MALGIFKSIGSAYGTFSNLSLCVWMFRVVHMFEFLCFFSFFISFGTLLWMVLRFIKGKWGKQEDEKEF